VRRKRGNRKLECSGGGHKLTGAYDCSERAVRDLPSSEFRSTVPVEIYQGKVSGLRSEGGESSPASR
jgi:hypothetical protein